MDGLSAADRQQQSNKLAEEHGKPARDVTPGEPWIFPNHRTMAEVIAAERRP
jgi:hypothetical protein